MKDGRIIRSDFSFVPRKRKNNETSTSVDESKKRGVSVEGRKKIHSHESHGTDDTIDENTPPEDVKGSEVESMVCGLVGEARVPNQSVSKRLTSLVYCTAETLNRTKFGIDAEGKIHAWNSEMAIRDGNNWPAVWAIVFYPIFSFLACNSLSVLPPLLVGTRILGFQCGVTLLFDGWKTQTWPTYCLSLLAVFLFSVFHEYVVHLRSRFKDISTGRGSGGIRAPLLGQSFRVYTSKIVESVLFGLNVGLGYMLMLAVMSFNGGVFSAAVLGFVFGHFIFRSGSEEKGGLESTCACA
eukprot:Gb_03879 [translate_table: standard]